MRRPVIAGDRDDGADIRDERLEDRCARVHRLLAPPDSIIDHHHGDGEVVFRHAFLFLSERKAPLSVDGVQKLVERLGVAAGFAFPIHAHMLRHSAGYALAGRGVDTRTLQAFMGPRSIGNTVIYTAVVLLSLRIGPHVLRRHQSGIVPELLQLPAEVMRPDASLHADQAG